VCVYIYVYMYVRACVYNCLPLWGTQPSINGHLGSLSQSHDINSSGNSISWQISIVFLRCMPPSLIYETLAPTAPPPSLTWLLIYSSTISLRGKSVYGGVKIDHFPALALRPKPCHASLIFYIDSHLEWVESGRDIWCTPLPHQCVVRHHLDPRRVIGHSRWSAV
jgi:hypothetical protein